MDHELVESVRLFCLDGCACIREDLRPQFAVWGRKREKRACGNTVWRKTSAGSASVGVWKA